MCCDDPCKVARCPGCPETDWSSFTFRADQPAAALTFTFANLERRFDAVSVPMIYPANCPCAWVHYAGDFARDTGGVYNPNNKFFVAPSISRLERIRTATGFTWRYSITRYAWDWDYWFRLGLVNGSGWNWGPNGPFGEDQNGCEFGWGYGWGFGRFGYGGWGPGGYRYGFDPAYWYYDFGMQAVYDLASPFVCRGTTRFLRNDAFYAGQEGYVGDVFPAFVDITRIPRDTVLT